MKTVFRAFWICVLLVGLAPIAQANPFIQITPETLRICTVERLNEAPPAANSPRCAPATSDQIDPQGRVIWVLGSMPSPVLQDTNKPVGLFISAKAASRVIFNEHEIGQNGAPGLDPDNETPGALDAVYNIPIDQLHADTNDVALLMSGHNNLIQSSRPVLLLGLWPYLEPPHHERDTLWFSFATLGLFVIAGLYATITTGLRLTTLAAAPLALTCLFAGGQVVAESLRSIWVYPYPVHDLRLMAITLCGLGAGMTLAAHVALRLKLPRAGLILAGIMVVSVGATALAEGFDNTASRAILVPNILTAALAAWQARKGDLTASLYAGGLLIFVGLNLFDPGEFLDLTYFFALSALVLFLTVLQATAYREALLDRADADRRRMQLERALERVTSGAPTVLTLRHAGRIDRVRHEDIVLLEAAGDYVMIQLADSRELLPTIALSALEKQLPDSFVRVHRSYIVNSERIEALTRHRDRTGELVMSTGQSVPVSRRIMPRLRRALGKGEINPDPDAPPAARDRP